MVRKNYRIGPLSAYMLAHLQILTEHNQYYKYEFFFFFTNMNLFKKTKKKRSFIYKYAIILSLF